MQRWAEAIGPAMVAFQRGSVLGIDVARDAAFGVEEAGGPSLLRRLVRVPAEAPDIVSLLYRAATVSGDAQTVRARSQASQIIHPPLETVPLRAWTSFEDVVQIGYRHTCSCIEAGALDVFKV